MGGALGIAVLGSILSSLYRADIVHRLAGLPAGVQERARGSIVTTLNAAEAAGKRGDGRTAAFLAQQGREAFGQAFGRTMLCGTAVILVNAAIVWTFQGRHKGHEASDAFGPASATSAAVATDAVADAAPAD
jgi:DHA2 family multidrug resistance protein-like MFS transporter